MKAEEIDYRDGSLTLPGLLAYDETAKGKRPGIVVVAEAWDKPASRPALLDGDACVLRRDFSINWRVNEAHAV